MDPLQFQPRVSWLPSAISPRPLVVAEQEAPVLSTPARPLAETRQLPPTVQGQNQAAPLQRHLIDQLLGPERTPHQLQRELPPFTQDVTRHQRLLDSPLSSAWQKHDGAHVRRLKDSDGDWLQVRTPEGSFHARPAPAQKEEEGPPWVEVRPEDGRKPYFQRTIKDPQGGPDWTEYKLQDGTRWKHRQIQRNGETWDEQIFGTNRTRMLAGGTDALMEKARKGGVQTITVAGPEGPLQIRVVGGVKPEELQRVKSALESIPVKARIYAQEIHICDDLGDFVKPDGSTAPIAGFAGFDQTQPATRMILRRGELISDFNVRHILFHEMGHNVDASNGNISRGGPWGHGPSVSEYGDHNHLEDYAEVHREVLMNLDWFRQNDELSITMKYGAAAHKILEILKFYDIQIGKSRGIPGGLPFPGKPQSPPPLPPRQQGWPRTLGAA